MGHGRVRSHSHSSALQLGVRIADDILDFIKLYIEVSNCSFHNNKVTSTSVWIYQTQINPDPVEFHQMLMYLLRSINGRNSVASCIQITFKNSRFYNNTLSKLDSVFYISNSLYIDTSLVNVKDCYTYQQAGTLLKVEVQNCLFQSNTAQNEIIFVRCIPPARFIIANSTASDNSGTAITAIKAVVTFKGVNTIVNNTGFDGGGVFLDSSYLAFFTTVKVVHT